MTAPLPPLSGGYPTVAVVSIAGRHRTCGWVLLASDDSGTEILDQGAGTTGAVLNTELAEKVILQAEQRASLIRTWRAPLTKAVIDAGGEAYLDVPVNILHDDPTYLAAMSIAEGLCGERADIREHSGAGRVPAPQPPLVIAVDGSRSRSGEGSWAWIDDTGRWDSFAGRFPSPLQAELSAIAGALRSAPAGRALRILCDSRSAIHHARRALAHEKTESTLTNDDARALGAITRDGAARDVQLEWVKGHNGHPLNDRADRLAVHARRSAWSEHTPEYQLVAHRIADLEPALV